jgi:hypothetical protein
MLAALVIVVLPISSDPSSIIRGSLTALQMLSGTPPHLSLFPIKKKLAAAD